jgi:hypothetical protein
MPKIVKSSSSTEKAKLETLYSPNKGSPKVIKSHEDSEIGTVTGFKFPRQNKQGLMLRKVILELNQRKSWIE